MADSCFKCTVCHKVFSQKRNLTRHMLTHEEAKHICGSCAKPFHRKDLLAKHRVQCCRKAVNGKICDLCNSSFSQKCSMTRHRKVCQIKQTARELEKSTNGYNAELSRGEMLEKILRRFSSIKEEALGPSDTKALSMYQSACGNVIDMTTIVLKS